MLLSASTRFRIDRIILDDRIESQQYHPQGVVLDGLAAGRSINEILVEREWAVDAPPATNNSNDTIP